MFCFLFQNYYFSSWKNSEPLKWYSSATMHNSKRLKVSTPHSALMATDLWQFVQVWKCNRHIQWNSRIGETNKLENNVHSLYEWHVKNVNEMKKIQ